MGSAHDPPGTTPITTDHTGRGAAGAGHPLAEFTGHSLPSIPIALARIGLDRRVINANSRFLSLTGMAPGSCIGRPIFDTISDTSGLLAQTLRRVLSDRATHDGIEVRFHAASSGAARAGSMNAQPTIDAAGSVDGALLAVVPHIGYSGQSEIQRELRLMRETAHMAHIGSWELDYSTGSLYWSPETYRIHDTTPEDYSPQVGSAIDFYAPGSREVIAEAVRSGATTGAPWDLELELVTAKGRRINVRASGLIELHEGKPVRAYGAFQDITEQKKLEHQLLAASKMETIGRMAGGIAHDFNNWITAILSYADMALGSAPIGAPERQALERIRQAAEHATTLTRQLVSLSRPRPISTVLVDLNDLLRSMLPLITGMIGKQIAVRTNFHPRSLTLRTNASQLRQVLLNLFINARDAMPKGGTIEVSTSYLELPSAGNTPPLLPLPPGNFVVFTVSDTGEGMTPDVLEHLFEPFFTTKPGGKGTGLGLATCYSIIKGNGGHIGVESSPGAGSRFSIYLPAARTTPDAV